MSNWDGVPPEIRKIFEDLDELQRRSSIRHYKLVGREVVPVEHLLEWAQWYETAERHIAVTEVGEFTVSTIFLGLDHGFPPYDKLPILFETMVHGAKEEQEIFGHKRMMHQFLDFQERYATYEQAEAGHRAMCEEITRLLANSETVTAKALSQAKQTRGD
jgi:hypothetical protein